MKAVDDGIRGKDCLVVRGGALVVDAGGDGLKSDNEDNTSVGYVAFESGSLTARAGGDGIAAATTVSVVDGTFELTTGGGSGANISEDLVDGQRTWTGESGKWVLHINQVEMRWVDPVPQSGSYSLDAPLDKSVSLTFDRVGDDTINVRVTGPKNSFDLDVSRFGQVES